MLHAFVAAFAIVSGAFFSGSFWPFMTCFLSVVAGTTDATLKEKLQTAFEAMESEKADAPLAWVLAVSPILLLNPRKIDKQALSNTTLFEVCRSSLLAGSKLTVIAAFVLALS